MSRALISEAHLAAIADAIRLKRGAETAFRPGDMAAAIAAIVTPNVYTAGDEGKVVANGALVQQTARAAIIANGAYDTTLHNQVTVNVAGGGRGNYIIDPDVLDLYATAFNGHFTNVSNVITSVMPAYCYGADAHQETIDTMSLGGESVSAWANSLYTNRKMNMIWPIIKIPASATKLVAALSANSYSSGASNGVTLYFVYPISNTGNTGGPSIENRVERIIITYIGWTAAQINEQATVTFETPLTSNLVCPAQTVEIDLSSYNTDLFLGIFNVASDLKIRDIHWE